MPWKTSFCPFVLERLLPVHSRFGLNSLEGLTVGWSGWRVSPIQRFSQSGLRNPWGFLDIFRESASQTIFLLILRCYLPLHFPSLTCYSDFPEATRPAISQPHTSSQWMQKQMWESICLLWSQTLKRFVKIKENNATINNSNRRVKILGLSCCLDEPNLPACPQARAEMERRRISPLWPL